MFVLGDCETGYISSSIPYFGSATIERLIRPDLRLHLGLCSIYVISYHSLLVEVVFIYIQTAFVPAANRLQSYWKKRIHLARTVNKSRKGLPIQFKRLNMKKGEMQVFHKNVSMISLAWKDKSVTLMLSTYHSMDTQREERVVRGGVSEEAVKPKVVCD
jgi:hypothetical protein